MKLSIDPANVKALAFDLDGTILAPGALLTERTRSAITACAKKGIGIILSTGRSIEATEKFRAELGLLGPMVYYNGAIVAEHHASSGEVEILHTLLLSAEAMEFCVDLSRSTKIYFQAYLPPIPGKYKWMLMSEIDGPERDMYANHTGVKARLGDLKEEIKANGRQGCIKGMFLTELPQVLDDLRPRLEEHFGNSVYLSRSTTTYLEILNAKASKGTGLAFALEKRGIKSEETIAFGDEENDLPMLKTARYSVAPGNAIEAVKAVVDHVTLPNSEDGIAVFLEELFSL